MRNIKNFKSFNEIKLNAPTLKKVGNLKVGEFGYTVPWMLNVDDDDNCFIEKDVTLDDNKAGTCQLKISRNNNGYIAHINDLDDHYKNKLRDYVDKLDDDVNMDDYIEISGFDDKEVELSLEDQLRDAIENEDFETAAKIRNRMNNR